MDEDIEPMDRRQISNESVSRPSGRIKIFFHKGIGICLTNQKAVIYEDCNCSFMEATSLAKSGSCFIFSAIFLQPCKTVE